MAVYFDLGMDCGTSEDVADQAVRHFGSLVIELPELAPIQCRVGKAKKGEHWFVHLWPEGMGYGTHPFCRIELVSDANARAIRDAIYKKLEPLNGYRRALFGAEVYETVLAGGTPEEYNDIDYLDMVFRREDFPIPAKGSTVRPFSPGYLIVTHQER